MPGFKFWHFGLTEKEIVFDYVTSEVNCLRPFSQMVVQSFAKISEFSLKISENFFHNFFSKFIHQKFFVFKLDLHLDLQMTT